MTTTKPASPVTGLIENEKLLRRSNERAQKRVKRDFTVAERAQTTIHFYCECSNLPCAIRIRLTEAEYEAIHQERDKFIVAKGHEIPSIEKIIAEHDDFYVIEKYVLAP
jgi:redox-regulated HSP33 family molecular chaperone